jgi:hypothetical protein
MTPQPFAVLHSARALELLAEAIRAATVAGLRTEALAAALTIERALTWYADGFGESRMKLKVLGELRWGFSYPLSVWFAVDVARRTVQVSRYRFAPRRTRGSS